MELKDRRFHEIIINLFIENKYRDINKGIGNRNHKSFLGFRIEGSMVYNNINISLIPQINVLIKLYKQRLVNY